LSEALRLLASGGFLRYLPTRRAWSGKRRTWQAESGRNTQFGTNCGRLPVVFRAAKHSGVCRRHGPPLFCIGKSTDAPSLEADRDVLVFIQLMTAQKNPDTDVPGLW